MHNRTLVISVILSSETLSFLVSIPHLSTVLIYLNVEKTRTEVAGGWKGEHMKEMSGGLEPDLDRWGENGSLKDKNWEERRSLEFRRK